MTTTATDRLFGLNTAVAVKAPVRAVSTANLTLSGLQTVGGVVLVADDRVLVKDQTDATENGIYLASSSAWQRAADFDGSLDVVQGTLIVHGTDTTLYYRVTSANPITPGTSEIEFEVVGTAITQASIGAAWRPQSTGESSATPTVVPTAKHFDWGYIPRYGSTGDGVANDTTAVTAAIDQAEGSLRHVKGQPGDTHLIASGFTPTGTLLVDLFGTTIKATASINVLDPTTRLDLHYGKFDTFLRAISNTATTDPTLDLLVAYTEFVNGANSAINIECPVRDFKVLGLRCVGNSGYNVRLGNNTYALQSGWSTCLIAGGFFKNVTHLSNDVAAIISYAPFSRILFNHIVDVNGFDNTDTAFIYMKSPYGLAAFNSGDDIDSTGTRIIGGIKLKGTNRGTSSTPNGYAAAAVLNVLRTAADDGTGVQVEADEQAVILNYIEGFKHGIVGGSGTVNKCLVASNRLHYLGALTTGRGVDFGSVNGFGYLIDGNVIFGYASSGVRFSTTGAETIDGISILNEVIKGLNTSQGNGVTLDGAATDSITNVILANLQISTWQRAANFINVKGATLDNIRFSGLASSVRPYVFTTCKNIRATKAFSTTAQTTDAAATDVFELAISSGNVLKMTVHAMARQSDGSEVANLRRDFLFKDVSGTTTLVASGTLVNDGGSGLPADALLAVVDTNVPTAQIKGVVAETWDWTINIDFDLH